ncbi:DnaB-like helicase C-terminal domain-containing protein [Halobaculum halobium]|uniref:DnaB-like helicase C-terminal domain-containing protein n=1 Tax=Halobaculum halobium TaxID=3032281 RepID=A0ABD5T782_9EURY
MIGVRGQPDRRLQIEEITRQFKVLTNELNIPIVLLSQLSRGVENRQDKQPVLSDLRESGSIEQDSNAIGFLWNSDRQDEKSDIRTVTLTIAKNREGALGSIDFRFSRQSCSLRWRIEMSYPTMTLKEFNEYMQEGHYQYSLFVILQLDEAVEYFKKANKPMLV